PPVTRPRSGRSTQRHAGTVLRGRTGEPYADDQHHQWLEPHGCRLQSLVRTRNQAACRKGSRLMTDISSQGDAAESFDPLRPKLIRVAYRMLGSVADAEDMVQEAFIRWMNADRSEVREPEAFLRRTVTRLCLDFLKSGRNQRETYFGPWIPDPVVEEEADDDVTL